MVCKAITTIGRQTVHSAVFAEEKSLLNCLRIFSVIQLLGESNRYRLVMNMRLTAQDRIGKASGLRSCGKQERMLNRHLDREI